MISITEWIVASEIGFWLGVIMSLRGHSFSSFLVPVTMYPSCHRKIIVRI